MRERKPPSGGGAVQSDQIAFDSDYQRSSAVLPELFRIAKTEDRIHPVNPVHPVFRLWLLKPEFLDRMDRPSRMEEASAEALIAECRSGFNPR
jgi:hypothetical protein